MKKVGLTIIVFLFIGFTVYCQVKTIEGTVLDENGEALIGATIVAASDEGALSAGAITDVNGNFSIDLPLNATSIMVSFIGYEKQSIEIGNKTSFRIILKSASTELDDIVVTALGIKKSEKALGYAFTNVEGDELTSARDVNFINSISGKVAGVSISQTSGGAGTSSRIIIRGIKSIAGNSQPLIILDGVPIDNSSDGASWLGGVDYGNGLMDISPDDIESMSVLKGPNAAALYGARAANGVIMITSKKGSQKDRIKVTINSNFMFDRAYILGDYQNEYGAGFGGNMTRDEVTREFYLGLTEEDRNSVEVSIVEDSITHIIDTSYYIRNYYGTGSWGPKFNDTLRHYTWYGQFADYKPQPNNAKDYFEKGFTATNTISIESGNERNTWRFSVLNLKNK